ncbi:MAG: hypothetical protein HYY43_02415 [Deltaproteobacteria bacterium]|nr:hypothetical protein [Deltaproteobacteria bacterium]MBI2974428.1 hypothetical protein [Deltaproteobacteria bacterium]
MTDTSPQVNSKMIEMIRLRSGEERLKMGADMFDMAKRLILASLDCNDSDVRTKLFLRVYGNDFSTEEKGKILKHFGA